MATLTLSAQDVNGDPFTSGGNINIVNGGVSTLTFTDFDFQLSDPQPGETVSLDGGATQLNYQFLGYGDVRNDPSQHGAFIRVDLGNGSFRTFAIDMNADGDQAPTLATGNTKLAVANLSPGPSERFPAPACFTPGTLIDTPQGSVPVEHLSVGDRVSTLDAGAQPLRAVLSRVVLARGRFAPVRFAPGALGNERPLVVSPQHRMLIRGWQAQLFAGQDEVLVAARHLVNGRDITCVEGGALRYIHLVFDAHQIVWGNGVLSESYYIGADEDDPTNDELRALFADFAATSRSSHALARPALRGFEARALAA